MQKSTIRIIRTSDVIMAWLVHAFTASGAILGILALHAIQQGDLHEALLWLFLSFVIDTVDGTLARAARVSEVLPNLDGRMLDYVIDFVNIVFIPAYFFYVSDLLPESIRLWAVIAILLTSCYHYANRRALTPDFFFEGFPAMWSIIVFYLFFLHLQPEWNAVLVAFFCLIHIIPIKIVYPTRTPYLRVLNLAFVTLSIGCNLLLLYSNPQPPSWILIASIGGVTYLGGFSLLATLKERFSPTTVRS